MFLEALLLKHLRLSTVTLSLSLFSL